MEFKENENTIVKLSDGSELHLQDLGLCRVNVKIYCDSTHSTSLMPKEIYELIEDGIKFGILKKAEKIKQNMKIMEEN